MGATFDCSFKGRQGKGITDIGRAAMIGIVLEQWGSRVVQGWTSGEHELALFGTRELTLSFSEGIWGCFAVGSGRWLGVGGC